MSDYASETEASAAYLAFYDGYRNWADLPETSGWAFWRASKERYRQQAIEAEELAREWDAEDDAAFEASETARKSLTQPL